MVLDALGVSVEPNGLTYRELYLSNLSKMGTWVRPTFLECTEERTHNSSTK